jgi:hypothetical protein
MYAQVVYIKTLMYSAVANSARGTAIVLHL